MKRCFEASLAPADCDSGSLTTSLQGRNPTSTTAMYISRHSILQSVGPFFLLCMAFGIR